MSNEPEKQAGSQIPTIRAAKPTDEPALLELYEKMYPGRGETDIELADKSLAIVLERNGKITAAAIGNPATVAQVVLFADPGAAGPPETAHDVAAALDAIEHVIQCCTLKGASFATVVFVPARLKALRETLIQMGFLGTDEVLSTYASPLTLNQGIDQLKELLSKGVSNA